MKVHDLKKRLVKTSVVALVGSILFSACVYWIQSYREGLEKEEQEINGHIAARQSEYNEVKKNFELTNKAKEFFASHEKDPSIRTENFKKSIATTILQEMTQKYRLAEMSFAMEPFAESGGDYARKTTVVISSKITLKFGAITDSLVFDFLSELPEKFPGHINILSVTMKKSGDIIPEALGEIGKGNTPAFLSAEIVFLWNGIKHVSQETAQGGGE